MMTTKCVSRRTFIHRGCSAALAAGGLVIAPSAQANEQLSEDDPTALALGYKHDAEAVDGTKYPKRAGADGKSQFCDNCALYADASAGADGQWTPCSIFQNRLVAAKGWCNAWVAKG